jgi:anti-sigma regulatory factor (Ser/Thr protein kinase)
MEISSRRTEILPPGGGASPRRSFTARHGALMHTKLRQSSQVFDLPPAPCAVPEVRRAVLDALAEWGLPADGERAYSLGVIASELITNAVTHAGRCTPRIFVILAIGEDDTLRLGVRDNLDVSPRLRPRSSDATSGRGMALVKELVMELGGLLTTKQCPGGKTVWAELPAFLV